MKKQIYSKFIMRRFIISLMIFIVTFYILYFLIKLTIIEIFSIIMLSSSMVIPLIYLQVISHEFGHYIETKLLISTTYYSKEKSIIKINIDIFLRTSRIDSTFFEYLSKNKHNKQIQIMIKKISIAGLKTNLIITPLLIYISSKITNFILNETKISIYIEHKASVTTIIIINLLTIWLISSFSGIKTDIEKYLHPEKYVYVFPIELLKNNTKNTP